MRGYLSFILVLASALTMLNLVILYWQPERIDLSKAIAIERVYQAQMNVKEVVLESIRRGGMEGFALYNSSHSVLFCDPELGGPAHPNCFRIEEAGNWTRAGAFYKLTSVDTKSFDDDLEVDIWCMKGINEDVARSIASSKSCPSCLSYNTQSPNLTALIASGVSQMDCADFIYPQIVPSLLPEENPILKNMKITGGVAGSIGGSIGISTRYPRFNISAVSYLPTGYEVMP